MRRWLDSWGFTTIVSRDSQKVATADYSGRILQLSLAQFEERIPSRDPRRDSWTEALESWFLATIGEKNYEIWFVRDSLLADILPQVFSRRLADHHVIEAVSNGGIASAQPGWIGFALALIGSIQLLLWPRSRRLVIAGLWLPWAVFLVFIRTGSGAFVIGAMAIIPYVSEILCRKADFARVRNWGSTLGFYASAFLPAALPLYAAFLLRPSTLSSYFLLGIASTLCASLAFSIRPEPQRKYFVPVPILKRRFPFIRVTSVPLLAFSFGLSFMGVLPSLISHFHSEPNQGQVASEIEIPIPLRTKLENSLRKAALPGLDAWERHVTNETEFFARSLRISSIPSSGIAAVGPKSSPETYVRPHGIEEVIGDQHNVEGFAIAKMPVDATEPLALWRIILYIILPSLTFIAILKKSFASRRLSGHHP